MTRQEAGKLGGLATFQKYGKEHMQKIGSMGFWATIESLSAKQEIPTDYRGNPYRHLLRNLKRKHGG